MWDRCRVDLGTINAESLKLSNSNPGFQPLQLLRVRTAAPTTNSGKMPSSLKSAGVVSGQRRRTKSSEFEPRFTLIPLHVVWFPTSFSEQKLLNPRYISLSSVNPQRTGSWFQRWRVRRRLQPTSARVYWRVAGARRRAGSLTYL
ncbi:uncharacterized protein LOC126605589 isoform X2 [Malus sylvestris]|uniref:uncharacterized protein LOC126605589 isoform X2 n=1 Tax=Malus sylvestris TaxID=3752 RepID=UPI0021AD254D|nr:uncharacterized protein LOC126605589 isoform X2 [Malus sylvestris]